MEGIQTPNFEFLILSFELLDLFGIKDPKKATSIHN